MREWTEDAIEKAENVVYLLVAVVLVVVAAVVLGASVVKFTDLPDLGVISTAAEVLDLLLLVFIVVELAVRRPDHARRARAGGRALPDRRDHRLDQGDRGPVGEGARLRGRPTKIEDLVWLMGVLTLTIGVLAVSTLLVRRKEREPSEGDHSGPDAAHKREADQHAEAS